MGVPSLFRWLVEKYPGIIKQANSKYPTDNLYLDFNGIIHPCCNPQLGETPKTEIEMYENISRVVDNMIERIRPRELIYISIDGVAPRAKLNQQRARRYKSASEVIASGKKFFIEKKEENIKEAVEKVVDKAAKEGVLKSCEMKDEEIKEESGELNDLMEISSEDDLETFDCNSITPGTPFMARLDSAIKTYIKYKLSSDPLWKNLKVIYSGCGVPGEGEQKIMSFIRSQRILNRKVKHTIYSPDADLIFLGLSLNEENVKIMRDDPFFWDKQRRNICKKCNKKGHFEDYCGNFEMFPYLFVDIKLLKMNLENIFRTNAKNTVRMQRIIDDWVFICFLCGNDFLPPLPCFEIRFEAIESLTKILIYTFNKHEKYITNQGELDFDVLKSFLEELAYKEDYYYERKRNMLRKTRRRFSPHGVFEEIPLHTLTGKLKYYNEKLQVDGHGIKDVCRDYLSGLAWTYSYYTNGLKSWSWYYPHHYAPFAIDLSIIKNFTPKFSIGKPLKPLEQIMAVLPPVSKDIVPEKFHPIFEENKELFPENIKIDMFDKLLPWQGVVLLPFIDVKKLVNAVNEKVSSLKTEDIYRNVVSTDLLFVSETHYLYPYLESIYSSFKPFSDLKDKTLYGKILPYCYAEFPGTEINVPNLRKFTNKSIAVTFDIKNVK